MALSASFTHEDATPLWDSRKSAFLRATDTNVDFKRARYAGRHRRTPTDAFQLSAKRAFDLTAAGAALMFFAPLLIGVA